MYSCFSEAVEPQDTTIACTACPFSPFVTTPGQFIRNMKLRSQAYNFRFVHVKQRSVKLKPASILHCCLCRKICHTLVSL